MKRKKLFITVAIDSPAAAGAGTQSKLIAKHYNLLYLDTGKIYRYLAKITFNEKKINYNFLKKKIDRLNLRKLNDPDLLSDRIAKHASIISKDKKIRKIVKQLQLNYAYNPPNKFFGSVLDGRDITSVIMKDAMFKFYITANVKVRARRRFNEFRKIKKNISYNQVLKSLRNRDYLDKNRKHSPLKKTKDSILINTSKLSKKACFLKIKAIMNNKIN